jgi:hypothetical protein
MGPCGVVVMSCVLLREPERLLPLRDSGVGEFGRQAGEREGVAAAERALVLSEFLHLNRDVMGEPRPSALWTPSTVGRPPLAMMSRAARSISAYETVAPRHNDRTVTLIDNTSDNDSYRRYGAVRANIKI